MRERVWLARSLTVAAPTRVKRTPYERTRASKPRENRRLARTARRGRDDDARDEPADRPAGNAPPLRRAHRHGLRRRWTPRCPSVVAVFQAPWYRITRSTHWKEDIDPWKEPDRLPLLSGGLLAELIYGDEPRLFNDLRVPADDPAAVYLADYRSVAAVPLYDQGVALNMALLMRRGLTGRFSTRRTCPIWS